MAFSSNFFNSVSGDRLYNADTLAARFALFFTDGIFYRNSASLRVSPSSGMNINIQTGAACLRGYTATNDSTEQKTLTAGHALYDRIDAVCVRLNLVDRTMDSFVVEGTPSASPQRPDIYTERTGDYSDLCLAYVHVSAGTIAIYEGDITDTRLDSSVCGIVMQAVQQVETSELYAQFQYSLTQFLTESEQTFNEWFTAIRAQLEQIDIGDIEDRVLVLEGWKDIEDDMEYLTTGVSDNVKLTNKVQTFLNGSTTDGRSLCIRVVGSNFVNGATVVYGGTQYNMVFATTSDTTTNRRVKLDFSSCSKISATGYGIYAGSNIELVGLNYATTGRDAITSQGVRLERCQIVGAQNCVTGTHAYAKDCKLSASGYNGTCCGILAGGYYENCDVDAQSTSATGMGAANGAFGIRPNSTNWGITIVGGSYRGYVRSSATTSEGIGIYIPAGLQLVTLNVTGARCPQVARSNYVQTQSIKVNTGYGTVHGTALYQAAAVYSTVNFDVKGNPINNIVTGLS